MRLNLHSNHLSSSTSKWMRSITSICIECTLRFWRTNFDIWASLHLFQHIAHTPYGILCCLASATIQCFVLPCDILLLAKIQRQNCNILFGKKWIYCIFKQSPATKGKYTKKNRKNHLNQPILCVNIWMTFIVFYLLKLLFQSIWI